MKNKIFEFDWFSNRDKLGKYKFDKSNAIYDFSENSVSKILWGKALNDLVKHPRNIEYEFEGINSLINRNKFCKVTLNDSEENEFYTDGEQIVLSSAPILSLGNKGLDILLGALVHESSHIRFTNFNLPKNKKMANNKAIHWIWNILEDEVIEEMLQIEKPGLGNVLGPIKDYMFSSDELSSEDDLDQILYTLFAIIRYPINLKNVPKDWLNDHSELFENIYKILQKNNVLNISIKDNCSKETYQSAIEIYKLIAQEKNIKLPKFKNQKQCKGKCNGNGKGEGSNKNESPEESKESNKSNQSLDDKFDENGNPSESITSDMKSTTIGGSTMESQSEKEINNIKNKINKSNPISHQKINKENPDIKDKEEESEDTTRGVAPCKFLNRITWNKSDEQKYNKLKNNIKQYIKLIQNIQINRENKRLIITKSDYLKNGQLTGRTLAQAYQGDKNVYTKFESKIGKEKINKFALVLALDESGSMCAPSTTDLVSSIAIAFAEAFRNNPEIEIFIYGHSESLVNYIDPKTKSYYSLGNRHKGGGQNEVYAYNTIIQDVLSKTNSDMLLVNITDAQYLANYADIENELRNWQKKIYQSLVVVDNNLNNSDIAINDKIYGKNNWAHIPNLKNPEKANIEFKKLIKYINRLSKQSHRNKK